MIVAAGLGTRLRPLTGWRPKPALPVRGLPLLAYQLELLAHHGVDEVMINAHHLPELLVETAQRCCPPRVGLRFSIEERLLDTGGAIRRVADFLRESDPCLIVGGDMLLDLDLTALLASHRERGDAVTLLLRDDPRAAAFGSIGIDREGCVRRIARRFDLGQETGAGLYAWVNVVAARALDSLPEREVFSHLDDWIAPLLAAGARDIRGELLAADTGVWEPVGTLPEYLAANLRARRFSYFDAAARAREQGTRFDADLVVGAGATLGPGASLRRTVIWDGEHVPAGFRGHDGVYAGGQFHSCGEGE
jgi:mannose-1-phosphate guanylyltransferase